MRIEALQLHAIDQTNMKSLIGATVTEKYILKDYDGIVKKIMIFFDNEVFMYLAINQENNHNLDILCFREREEDYVEKFFKSHRGRVEYWYMQFHYDYLKIKKYWLMQNNFGETDRLQIYFDIGNKNYYMQQISIINDRLRLYDVR